MATRVLFICNMNAVRSPMAAALLEAHAKGAIQADSAGLYDNDHIDPFVAAVLDEVGAPFEPRPPKTVDSLNLAAFDLAIALTPEAAEAARARMPTGRVELWATANPSDVRDHSRQQVLDAYRRVRDELARRIEKRFPRPGAP